MKLSFKKEAPSVPNFAALPPAPEHRARLYDHFAGIKKLPEPPWGATGCELQPGVVLVQTRVPDVFHVGVRLGEIWVELLPIVRPDDPGIRELAAQGRLVSFGESPRDRERREIREAQLQRERERANPPGPRRLRAS